MNDKITLAHGNGGRLTHDLINNLFLKNFTNNILQEKLDSAILNKINSKLAFTTDSYVVKPLFFPGGNIGKLAITGTVNDLAVTGSIPLYISCSFIIEEGFKISDLQEIVVSMSETAKKANVMIVTGDTKVVEKGNADGLYINTSGIGVLKNDQSINLPVKPGDDIIINGTIGDHGISILESREEFPVKTNVTSDCACLNHLIQNILKNVPQNAVKIMRDPTRGGIAVTLNEFIFNKNYSILINENILPIKDEVRAVCEITGFDPLYIANEGKVLIICDNNYTDQILQIMWNDDNGKNSKKIGTVIDNNKAHVILQTISGGKRIIDMLSNDMLPRIC